MKNRLTLRKGPRGEQLITTFGRARLVRVADGAMELRGAQASEQTMAKEWISLFLHEAVLRPVK
ncbi:MAG TPA: hypothetical protein VFB72_11400 [Verrucomicrobiae bacterium]|nr:hypothetical protein [Verrucomicrobiae bacterium]